MRGAAERSSLPTRTSSTMASNQDAVAEVDGAARETETETETQRHRDRELLLCSSNERAGDRKFACPAATTLSPCLRCDACVVLVEKRRVSECECA
jgi:hypothetical protein